jgi:lipopolysaccharide biosynthesis regulator YciM
MDIFYPHIREALVAAALLVALFLLLLRMVWSRRRTARRIRQDMLSVLPALERIAEGDRRELTKWLRRAARRYPDEVRTLVLIGDLLRAEGPLKATFLHKTLLYRKKLTDADKASILLSLGRDHIALEEEQKGLAALKQSLAAEKRATTLRELVALERRLALFDDALFHQKELNRLESSDRNEKLREIMLDAAMAAVAQNRREEVRRWVEMTVRLEGDTPFARLLDIFMIAFEGNAGRAADGAKEFLERYPAEELALRFLLATLPAGATLARTLPGPLAPIFAALADEAKLLSPQETALVDKKTLLYYHIAARTQPAGEMRELMAAVGRRERLFVCGACGRALTGTPLSCPGCGLPLAVKWGLI